MSRIFKGQDNHGNFINDLNPDQEDVAGAQPVDMDVRERSQPQQLIIRPGESGGVLRFRYQDFVLKKSYKKDILAMSTSVTLS